MSEDLAPVFLEFSAAKLLQFTSRVKDCLGRLTSDQIWARDAENQNAVGNLVLHLCGNVRQWIGSGVAGQPDIRIRRREFTARAGSQSPELVEEVERTVADAVAVLRDLSPQRLRERVTIQSYNLTVMEAIYHVVEHFAQHTGQIIFATKQLTGQDLGYYKHLEQSTARDENTP